MGTAQFLLELRRVVLLQAISQDPTGLNVAVNFIAMVVVIGQSGIHIGEGEMGIGIDNLICRQTVQLVPNVDVLDANAGPCNAGLSPADSGSHFNMLDNR
jgi:hypothetical protein